MGQCQSCRSRSASWRPRAPTPVRRERKSKHWSSRSNAFVLEQTTSTWRHRSLTVLFEGTMARARASWCPWIAYMSRDRAITLAQNDGRAALAEKCQKSDKRLSSEHPMTAGGTWCSMRTDAVTSPARTTPGGSMALRRCAPGGEAPLRQFELEFFNRQVLLRDNAEAFKTSDRRLPPSGPYLRDSN